jgi:hypothetical protein
MPAVGCPLSALAKIRSVSVGQLSPSKSQYADLDLLFNQTTGTAKRYSLVLGVWSSSTS